MKDNNLVKNTVYVVYAFNHVTNMSGSIRKMAIRHGQALFLLLETGVGVE